MQQDPTLDRFRRLRWTGTLAIVAGFVGFTGSALVSVAYFGVGELRSVWIDALSWIAVITFGFLVRFLQGSRSTGASIGLSVVVAALAGPAVISTAARLRWMNNPDVWPAPSLTSDISQEVARSLLAGGLALVIVAAVLAAVSAWIPVARSTSIPGSRIPRSPYRVEVLALIFAIVVLALATASDTWSWAGTYASFTQPAIVLSWLIPLTVVLALVLRSNGLGSLWAAAALAIVVLVEPAIRTLGLAIWSALGWLGGEDWWYQDQLFTTGRGLIVTGASAWIIVPSIFLIVVVLLWNTRQPLVEGPYSRETPVTAPLDPWSGVAFILAFIPLISLPALVLGHISYERVVSSERPLRGRILAATAIAIGILNLLILWLIGTGTASAIPDLWIGA